MAFQSPHWLRSLGLEHRVVGLVLGNLVPHARGGRVKWRCAGVFAVAGVVGSLLGAAAAKSVDGERLLALSGLVMIGVGLAMVRRRGADGDPTVRLTWESARRLLPMLISIGFASGSSRASSGSAAASEVARFF